MTLFSKQNVLLVLWTSSMWLLYDDSAVVAIIVSWLLFIARAAGDSLRMYVRHCALFGIDILCVPCKALSARCVSFGNDVVDSCFMSIIINHFSWHAVKVMPSSVLIRVKRCTLSWYFDSVVSVLKVGKLNGGCTGDSGSCTDSDTSCMTTGGGMTCSEFVCRSVTVSVTRSVGLSRCLSKTLSVSVCHVVCHAF